MRVYSSFSLRAFRLSLYLAAATAGVASLYAQSLTGPLSGYVFDSGKQSIRTVVGIPPAAHLGAAVLTQTPLASVAPNGRYAIALIGKRPNLIADLQTAPVVPAELQGSMDTPDRIVWAADSSAAVLFSSAASSLQFIHSVGTGPSVDPAIDLSAAGAGFVLLAADPKAGNAAIATNGSASSSVYLVTGSAEIWRVGEFDDGVAAGVFASDGTLYIAGQSSHRVWMAQNSSGDSVPQVVLGEAAGVHQPAALALDSTASLLYMADQADRRIRVYKTADWTKVDELTIDYAPSTLDVFGAAYLLVNARRDSSDPVLLLQTGQTRNVIFIPGGE